MKTKEKILLTSMDLFNRNGVGVVTTNHIAKALEISPGNLYFHYDNKEEILMELFKRMTKEIYKLWSPKAVKSSTPVQFIEQNIELYLKYRFFHREMYSLRRKDRQLSVSWSAHIQKMMKLLIIVYRIWVKEGHMVKINDAEEMNYVAESLLSTSVTYLQFFESPDRAPSAKSLERGKKHICRLLYPYTTGAVRTDLKNFLKIKSETF